MTYMAHPAVSPEFARALVALAEAYGTELTAARIRLYWQALFDLEGDRLQAAFRAAVRECKFFPSAAELRALAAGTTDDAALLAFGAFQRAASRFGSYMSLVVHDHAAAHALQATFGSWPSYCELEDIAVAAKRQEFCAAYRQARREQAQGHPVALMGLTDGNVGMAGLMRASGELSVIPAAAVQTALAGGPSTAQGYIGSPMAGTHDSQRLGAGDKGDDA